MNDGVKVSTAAVCKGGFKGPAAIDVCYTPYASVNTAGTGLLASPYSCDISTTFTCNAYNAAQTTVYS